MGYIRISICKLTDHSIYPISLINPLTFPVFVVNQCRLDISIFAKYSFAHFGEQATLLQRNIVLSFSQSPQGVNIFPQVLHGFCIFSVIRSLLIRAYPGRALNASPASHQLTP